MDILAKTSEYCNSDVMVNPDALSYLSMMMNRSEELNIFIHYFADKKQLRVVGAEHFILKNKLIELEVKEVMGSFACRILAQNQTVFEKIQCNPRLKERIRIQDYPYYDQKRNILFLRGRIVDKNNEPFIVNTFNLNVILDLLRTIEEIKVDLRFSLTGTFSKFVMQDFSFKDEESLDEQLKLLRAKCIETLEENKL